MPNETKGFLALFSWLYQVKILRNSTTKKKEKRNTRERKLISIGYNRVVKQKEIRIFFQKQSYKAQEAVVDEFYDKLFEVFLLFYTQQNLITQLFTKITIDTNNVLRYLILYLDMPIFGYIICQ